MGAGSVPFVLDLHAFCASGGFVSVLGVGFFCSLSGIIRFFVHPLSWLSCRTRAPGALEVRLWEFAFYCFPCIQWIVCVSCFFVCSFYGFLIFRLFVHPFDSFSFSGHCLGLRFLSKDGRKICWAVFQFSVHLLSSSALVKTAPGSTAARKR